MKSCKIEFHLNKQSHVFTSRTWICMQRSSRHVKLTESYRSIAIVSVFLLILLLFRSTQTVNKSGRQTPHSLPTGGLGWVWANSINTLILVTNVNIELKKHLCVWKVRALQKADLENKIVARSSKAFHEGFRFVPTIKTTQTKASLQDPVVYHRHLPNY